MDIEKTIQFLENSFLKTLLLNKDITDISYNGKDLFYLDNYAGRKKSEMQLDYLTIKDFIRQIANLCEKQFSYQTPILDVSFGRYRVNAVHQSICRKNNEEAISFCIRIASSKLKINIESGFLKPEIDELFTVLLKSKVSIVIGGLTGSGKTELQKYLLSKMEDNSRVIVIDNVLELDQLQINKNIDLNIWQVDEKNNTASIQILVRNALRSNPDWLIVAESRGAEMIEVLNSTLTGHPIITTIHSFDAISMPHRIAGMVMMNDKKINYDDILNDISYHMRFYVYLKREIRDDGYVFRYISSISYLNKDKMESLYSFDGEADVYNRISKEASSLLNFDNVSEVFKNRFLEEER